MMARHNSKGRTRTIGAQGRERTRQRHMVRRMANGFTVGALVGITALAGGTAASASPTPLDPAGAGASATCYHVRQDDPAGTARSFASIVASGDFTADDADYVGDEDSDLVNVAIWLHDVIHGNLDGLTTFYVDSFPVCV